MRLIRVVLRHIPYTITILLYHCSEQVDLECIFMSSVAMERKMCVNGAGLGWNRSYIHRKRFKRRTTALIRSETEAVALLYNLRYPSQ